MMTKSVLECPEVLDYLRRLDTALGSLPSEQAVELRSRSMLICRTRCGRHGRPRGCHGLEPTRFACRGRR